MKGGDFTQLRFNPQKHFTSVRMQQGRLLLDSDWNEQVDIQAYIARSQAIDMIGGTSGTSNPEAFKVKALAPSDSPNTAEDLLITAGRFYVDGILCEAEIGTAFNLTLADTGITTLNSPSNAQNPTKTVRASTLIVDGRPLEPNQWLAIPKQNVVNSTPETALNQTDLWVKITNVDRQTGVLTLSENILVPTTAHRLVTYLTQPDYRAPSLSLQESAVYAVYLDVWERHITAVEDSTIREKALEIPDTTTRTQTIWQLKLKATDELPSLPSPAAPDETEYDILVDRWNLFVQNHKDRQALMTAKSFAQQPLENQLYRVEIHQGGTLGTATFKWSRDNASVASAIEKIEDNVIVTKFDQQGWQSLKSEQWWLEITSQENELNGQPGVLVPFQSASLRKITFDRSRLTGPIPEGSNLVVRRWHMGTLAEIPTNKEYIELEQGIKVKFAENSIYETGDYWLIAARIDQIDWPSDGIEQSLDQPSQGIAQPLAQPPQGIQHHYALLAMVQLKTTGDLPQNLSSNSLVNLNSDSIGNSVGGSTTNAASNAVINPINQPKQFITQSLQDSRLLFPPLSSCLGSIGGVLSGVLELQNNLYITHQGAGNDRIDGRLGIGTKQPIARLHVRNTPTKPIQGTLSVDASDKTLLSGSGVQELHPGDTLFISGDTTGNSVLSVDADPQDSNAKIAKLEKPVTASSPSFTYQPTIVRLEDSDAKPQFIVTPLGRVGIGTDRPIETLHVEGNIKTQALHASAAITADSASITHNITTGSLEATGKIKGASLEITGNGQLESLTITQNIQTRSLKATENITGGSLEITGHSQLNSLQVTNGVTAASLNTTGNIEGDTLIGKSLRLSGSGQANSFIVTNDTSTNSLTATGKITGNSLEITGSGQLGDLTVTNGISAASLTATGTINGAILTGDSLSLSGNGQFNSLSVTNGITAATLTLGSSGVVINSISANGTLTDFHTAIPTDRTVKDYIDTYVDTVLQPITNRISTIAAAVDTKANKTGAFNQPFDTQHLTIAGNLKFNAGSILITAFTSNISSTAGNSKLPTESAVKTYVDNYVDSQIRSLNPTLSTKADISYVDREITKLGQELRDEAAANNRSNATPTAAATTTPLSVFSLNRGTNDREAILSEARTYVDQQIQPLQSDREAILSEARTYVDQQIQPLQSDREAILSEARTYVDQQIQPLQADIQSSLNNLQNSLNSKANQGGSRTQDFLTQNLTISGVIQLLHGVPINNFSPNDTLLPTGNEFSELTIPTQKAVKTYVDRKLSQLNDHLTNTLALNHDLTVRGKAGIGGDPQDDIALKVYGTIEGDVISGRLASPSSQTLKNQIVDLSSQEVSTLLSQLTPVKFSFKNDHHAALHAGFIAEEAPELLTDSEGKAIKVLDIVAILTKAVKDDRTMIETLSTVIQQQQKTIDHLTDKVKQLEQQESLNRLYRLL
ncbi:DUF6519 domain-containing protein [Alkalinema pantanalense CENA528]|uniref:DUF6519 domain-containing protein n=1 Tax=Alkalinema pantanalense TaxID=1620705 RepID=UPI003D6F2F2F